MRLLVALLFAVACARAQSHYEPFYSAASEGKPEWVQLMYADDPNFYEVVNAYQDYYLSHPFEKNDDTHFFKHWVARIRPYVKSDGRIVLPSAE